MSMPDCCRAFIHKASVSGTGQFTRVLTCPTCGTRWRVLFEALPAMGGESVISVLRAERL